MYCEVWVLGANWVEQRQPAVALVSIQVVQGWISRLSL